MAAARAGPSSMRGFTIPLVSLSHDLIVSPLSMVTASGCRAATAFRAALLLRGAIPLAAAAADSAASPVALATVLFLAPPAAVDSASSPAVANSGPAEETEEAEPSPFRLPPGLCDAPGKSASAAAAAAPFADGFLSTGAAELSSPRTLPSSTPPPAPASAPKKPLS